MNVTPLSQVDSRQRKVAVGEFDGVHIGHAAVITGSDTVLTFEPHPRAVVGPRGAPPLLTTLEQKADAIAELGVEELVVATFDESFSRLTPEQFIDQVLVDALGATAVSVGSNFRFGARAAGDAELLLADNRFSARVADLVGSPNGPVSSSRIREAVSGGEMAAAAAMLGRHFEMRGTVVHGEKRGRELGYPTANIDPTPGCVVPATGIYACFANGHPAVASLGVRPTFEANGRLLLEVHLLNFEDDLYGVEMKIEMIERLRGELAFAGADDLVAQMAADACAAQAR
jgi:riboflavin kinase / FMN adenylyltransferase